MQPEFARKSAVSAERDLYFTAYPREDPREAMPSIATLIGTAWNFGRKQPALTHVFLWLLLLPMLAMSLLMRFIDVERVSGLAGTQPAVAAAALGMLALIVVFVWGTACVLIVGKRMIAAKAGRTRTSFKAVTREARSFVIPLILTSILRSVFTFLWSILLIVPGIIYSIRTMFYFIVVVEEGAAYRTALEQSKYIMRGHVWSVFWRVVVLGALLFAPISIIDAVLRILTGGAAEIGIDILSAVLTAVSVVLFIFCIIQMYGALRPATAPVMGKHRKK